MTLLSLTPDELLTTTRSVRRRLDLTRPVEQSVIDECLTIAQQAPNSSNQENGHFLVVTDVHKRAALADLWRRGFDIYKTLPVSARPASGDNATRSASQQRTVASLKHLLQHLHEVPVLVLPCISPRPERQLPAIQSATWGSIAPATWSFMLAARARGLGTCWTSFHLFFEEEAARILDIPYHDVMQVAIIPLAYTQGTDFKRAPRKPLAEITHWNAW